MPVVLHEERRDSQVVPVDLQLQQIGVAIVSTASTSPNDLSLVERIEPNG